jgi:hypothetical protein
MLAIADQHLTLVQQIGALGPVNHVVHAIGDVDQLVVIQPDEFGFAKIEIGVVTGDDGVVHYRTGQLHGALHAARDHGIRIDDAARRLRLRNPRGTLRKEEGRHVRRGRDGGGVIVCSPMKEVPRGHHAKNRENGEERQRKRAQEP